MKHLQPLDAIFWAVNASKMHLRSHFHLEPCWGSSQCSPLLQTPSWWRGGSLPPLQEHLHHSQPSASNSGSSGLRSAAEKINSQLHQCIASVTLQTNCKQWELTSTAKVRACRSTTLTITIKPSTGSTRSRQQNTGLLLLCTGTNSPYDSFIHSEEEDFAQTTRSAAWDLIPLLLVLWGGNG